MTYATRLLFGANAPSVTQSRELEQGPVEERVRAQKISLWDDGDSPMPPNPVGAENGTPLSSLEQSMRQRTPANKRMQGHHGQLSEADTVPAATPKPETDAAPMSMRHQSSALDQSWLAKARRDVGRDAQKGIPHSTLPRCEKT